jgi:hypothetical protein
MRILNIIIYNPTSEYEVIMHDAVDKYLKSPSISSFVTSFFVVLRTNASGCPVEIEDNIIYVNGSESLVPGILRKTIVSIHHCIHALNIKFDYLYRTNISTVTDFVKLDKLICDYTASNTLNYGGLFGYMYYPNDKNFRPFNFVQGTNIIVNYDTIIALLYDPKGFSSINLNWPDDVAFALTALNFNLSYQQIDIDKSKFIESCSQEDLGKFVCYRNKTGNRFADAFCVQNIVQFLLNE